MKLNFDGWSPEQKNSKQKKFLCLCKSTETQKAWPAMGAIKTYTMVAIKRGKEGRERMCECLSVCRKEGEEY